MNETTSNTETRIADAGDVAVLPGTELLPEVEIGNAPVPYAESDDSEKAELDKLMGEIDLTDSSSIIFFGSKAQEQLTTISDSMLEGVRNKDVGAAGGALNSMVSVLRGFDVSGLDPNKKPGFFARLFGRVKPVAKFVQQYEEVRKQIDVVTDDLESHKTQLLRDITSLDKLYEANLDYFHTLEQYIAAGEEKLRVVDSEIIPQLEQKHANSEEVLDAQELRDVRSARDDLERRIHDLKLTRQVAMQSLPSIRMVQENDKGLVNKINSTLVNTVPLWRNQLAQAVTIFRSGQAAKSVRAANDLTNELLEKNAENLRTANKEVREEIERGVFDIESVKRANENLIASIEESLQIADEGKRKRAEAEATLQTLEAELRTSLSAAHAKPQQQTPSDSAGA
ncbi:toxic anion resistance protein [Granulosicoccaceae sp. 1_MG-2023]|nr:toxic anion resistance protein [Granulosicoccaceae sp. 1_MG-2023]